MAKNIKPDSRNQYRHFIEIATMWADNDVYGHMNNTVHYTFFDTAVNRYLVDRDALDVERSDIIGLVVESGCQYFEPIAFPDVVTVGVRVTKVGRTSVRYEVGLFRENQQYAAAQGHFIHVYVDRETRRPKELHSSLKHAVSALLVDVSGE